MTKIFKILNIVLVLALISTLGSNVILASEFAEIPYDVVCKLALKYGEKSVRIFQKQPTDDFSIGIYLGDREIEPLVVNSSKYVKIQLKSDDLGMGYTLVTNQKKGSMNLQVVTETIDFNRMERQGDLVPVDQFRNYYDKNIVILGILPRQWGHLIKTLIFSLILCPTILGITVWSIMEKNTYPLITLSKFQLRSWILINH